MSTTGSDDRYSRQELFAPIGAEGQARLAAARVALIGCGALGTVLANTLVRAGTGYLRICDRDFVELNNLQRQVLFDEDDWRRQMPKAIAAAEKLGRINSAVTIEPVVADVNHGNIADLADGVDLICDGTDNFETRYLVNDQSIASGTPWIYAAVIGATGLVMPVLPGDTPCLRCVFEQAPPPEMSPTCDTAGVIGPAVNVVASLQAAEALKILSGHREMVTRRLLSIDVWAGRVTDLNVAAAKSETCICCGQRRFEYLAGERGSGATTLCGRNAVQINPPRGSTRRFDLDVIAAKLEAVATNEVRQNRFLLNATLDRFDVTVFADGRAIIKGTASADEARTVYARYIGQ